jgi:hypothetical protein
MEYLFSKQFADDSEFDSPEKSAEVSSDFPDEDDAVLQDDLGLDDKDLYNEANDFDDDDETAKFTLSAIKPSNDDDDDDLERGDDDDDDFSEGPLVSFEPDLPELGTPVYLPAITSTGDSKELIARNNASALPCAVGGVALALTFWLIAFYRRGAQKKASKASYGGSSSPTIKRDLGV